MRRAAAIALAIAAALARPGAAQPAGAGGGAVPGVVAASSLEVSTQLCAVVGRYRFAAAADLVRVTLVSPGGRSDMHSMLVRTVPGEGGLARLDLGDISVEARRGVLRAVHVRDPATYVEIEAEPGASAAGVLRAVLPRLPIPELSLAFDEGEVDWCPLVSGVAWQGAERVTGDGGLGIRLRGRSDSGRVVLEIGAGRFRRLEADLSPDGETRLIVEATPAESGDPSGWGLDVAGRRRIDRLDRLRALGPAIEPGGRFPAITLLGGANGPEAAGVWAGVSEGALVPVLVYGGPVSDGQRGGLEAVRGALVECRRELTRGRLDGRYAESARLAPLVGVVALAQDGLTELRYGSYLDQWGRVFAAQAEPPRLLRTASEERVLDRLRVGAEMVLVLADAERRVLAVCEVGPGSSPGSIAAALLAGVPVLAQPASDAGSGSGADPGSGPSGS